MKIDEPLIPILVIGGVRIGFSVGIEANIDCAVRLKVGENSDGLEKRILLVCSSNNPA